MDRNVSEFNRTVLKLRIYLQSIGIIAVNVFYKSL